MSRKIPAVVQSLAALQKIHGIALVLTALLVGANGAAATRLHGFDVTAALVPVAELRPGGPPRDGIPALTDPAFVAADRASHLKPADRVLGVRVNGVAKAYPLGIMNWHEIVNDQFAGVPVAVTYCPLCGTGVAFSATVDGRRQLFGVSGLLYNSDVVLYDRESESLWSQLLGKAISGPRRGVKLQPLATSNTSWSDWHTRHPDTLVLSRDTGHERNYATDPYGDYARTGELMFPVRFRTYGMHPKQPVLGIEIEGRAVAYPLSELAQAGALIEDRIGSVAVRVRYDATHQTAEVSTADGVGLPGVIAYWFAWYAFHPETAVFRAASSRR
jgi:hypothetical protein